jgi:hypothetical protein
MNRNLGNFEISKYKYTALLSNETSTLGTATILNPIEYQVLLAEHV